MKKLVNIGKYLVNKVRLYEIRKDKSANVSKAKLRIEQHREIIKEKIKEIKGKIKNENENIMFGKCCLRPPPPPPPKQTSSPRNNIGFNVILHI